MEGGNRSWEAVDWLWEEGASQVCAIADSAREFMMYKEFVIHLFNTLLDIIFRQGQNMPNYVHPVY